MRLMHHITSLVALACFSVLAVILIMVNGPHGLIPEHYGGLGMKIGAPGNETRSVDTSNLLLAKWLHSCVRRSILCGEDKQ